ncbi:MAG TPA: hypothetical protein VJP83_17200, partial [Terriglobales bacterium]|nr:hypothetical protein [Terriglobales bacterium]
RRGGGSLDLSGHRVRIRRSAGRVATVVALTVAVLGYLSDLLVISFHPQPVFPILDAIVLGGLCGVIAWSYQRRQNRYLAERLEVIADMNHHVRNDLQVIQYSAYMTKDKEHIQRIEQSLGRIDWALREVLTGKQLRSGTERGTKE